jgi:uncharacterized protein DUF5916
MSANINNRKCIVIISLICISLCCMTETLHAQSIFPPPDNDKKCRLTAFHTTETIQIDGKLTERSWEGAPVAAHFIVGYPEQGPPASQRTEVRILYDNTNLYIGAVCHYQGGKNRLQVQDMRRDFTFNDNEWFNIMIDPFRDPRGPVAAFFVSPFGTQSDALFYNDGTVDYDWDAVWRVKCTVTDSTWIAEIAIPFSSLRFPAGDTTWSVNFCRNIHDKGETSGWSPWPLAFTPNHMEYAGLITGIHPPLSQTNLRFEPYTLVETSRNDPGTAPGNGAGTNGKKIPWTTKPEVGGEIKWAVNTNTLVEGTINTDFAQADVDQQVVNLTRSSVFFPEHRQFFKENANLFAVGKDGIIQPFFSRMIGLSDSAAPIPINGGLRVIHQSAKEAAGFLLIRQDGDSADQPAWFNIFRYKQNIGKDLQLGGMTVLRYNEGSGKIPRSMNTVGVVDGSWKISQPLLMRGMLSYSVDDNNGSKGKAALTEISYTGTKVYADLVESYVSKGYDAQTGFLARQDFINTLPSMQLFLTDKRLPHAIAFYNPQLNTSIFHTASTGALQEATVSMVPIGILFRNLDVADLTITKSFENTDSVFSPVPVVNIPTGKYAFTRYEFYFLSNQGAHYSMESRISTGGYYNGRLNSYFISLRAAPIPHISLLLAYTRNDFRGMSATGKATTHLFAPQLRLAMNPAILLSAFYQYNTAAGTGSFNGRISWEYRPLSFVYLVFNSLQDIHTVEGANIAAQRSGILKFSYIRQL